jgi:hypothetical protein
MGPQRVLQAAGLALLCAAATAHAAPLHERAAVIDLGPDDGGALRKELLATLVAAGFDVAIGDGIDDALAGKSLDKDLVALAGAMADAQRAFGAFDCVAAVPAANQAIAIAAQRQAAGLPVPELPRALSYVLLCADKAGDVDRAMRAARWLRTVGGSSDVPADVWKKYPDVDTVIDQEHVPLKIETDVAGAAVFVDFRRVGTAPLEVHLSAGEHLIAVSAGTRRGWASGKADPKQQQVTIPTAEHGGASSPLAARIASWKGQRPAPADIAWVMGQVRARVVLIRRGDTVEVWGRAGRGETPRILGGEDGVGKATDADDRKRVVAVAVDRVQTWNDRAPDPDLPLLVEKPGEGRSAKKDEPAKWWVYATLAGAVLGAAAIIYVNDAGTDRQRVELTFP